MSLVVSKVFVVNGFNGKKTDYFWSQKLLRKLQLKTRAADHQDIQL